jgi:hypothetical protein
MSKIFACRLPTDDSPILVKYGELGYWPSSEAVFQRMAARQGEAVTESALAASMFGWYYPAAQEAKNYAINQPSA